MAEYVVYPSGTGTSSLKKAKRLAREQGGRVENAKTEKVVYRANKGRRNPVKVRIKPGTRVSLTVKDLRRVYNAGKRKARVVVKARRKR
jgi:hypothetical protein